MDDANKSGDIKRKYDEEVRARVREGLGSRASGFAEKVAEMLAQALDVSVALSVIAIADGQDLSDAITEDVDRAMAAHERMSMDLDNDGEMALKHVQRPDVLDDFSDVNDPDAIEFRIDLMEKSIAAISAAKESLAKRLRELGGGGE